MSQTDCRVLVQARMGSSRFPGKVLAPLWGRPLICHVLARVTRLFPPDRVHVVTSDDPSDDPIEAYVRTLGHPVFRGARDDVLSRFQACLRAHPCAWFVRICADSPDLDEGVLRAIVLHPAREEADVVTNIFPRTFPRGHSVEMVRTRMFMALDPAVLSSEEREHVTAHFYRRASDYRILNVVLGEPSLAGRHRAVDTLEDLRRLEQESGRYSG